MVGRRLRSHYALHAHHILQPIAFYEQHILRLVIRMLRDERSVDGRDTLDDNVAKLTFDRTQPEVAVLFVVDVDSEPVVVRDDVDLLLSNLKFAVVYDGPFDVIESELKLIQRRGGGRLENKTSQARVNQQLFVFVLTGHHSETKHSEKECEVT